MYDCQGKEKNTNIFTHVESSVVRIAHKELYPLDLLDLQTKFKLKFETNVYRLLNTFKRVQRTRLRCKHVRGTRRPVVLRLSIFFCGIDTSVCTNMCKYFSNIITCIVLAYTYCSHYCFLIFPSLRILFIRNVPL